MLKKTIFCFYLFLVILSVSSCSDWQKELTEKENFQIDKKSAFKEAENLNRLVKENNFDEIYDSASFCVKETYTKQKFTEEMLTAVEKLKNVDSNINLWRFENLDSPLPYKYNLVIGYGIGKSSHNGDVIWEGQKDRNYAYLMTSWQNEDNQMKLAGYQILKSEGESSKWYGTSACVTTKMEVKRESEKTIVDAVVVVNTNEVKTIKKIISE